MLAQQIPISWAKRQASRAVANGLTLEKLFERAMISLTYGDDRDTITPLQLTLLQTIMVLETNDGSQAMLRHRLDPEIGPLGLRVLFGSPSLRDGLGALAKLYENSCRGIRFTLSTSGPRATLSIRADEDHEGGLFQEDIQLIYTYLGLTRFLGRPFPVSAVTTRDPTHPNLGSAHYAIGSPVRLGSCAGLHFSSVLLQSTPPKPALDEFLWRPIRDALHLIEVPGAATGSDVNNQTFRLENLAAERMMAPSTLRRRLARDGSSFRKLREQALLDATIDLLRHRSCCLDAIAAELGYADARSLRRFVKRATGRTPDTLRSEFHMAAPPAQLHARLKEVFSQMPH